MRPARLFEIETDQKNRMTIPAVSQLQARNKFRAKFEKSFGKAVCVREIKPEK
jgi:DNA-binding transcriptional regulator/RsmH inhibitor MraZ